MWVLLLVVAFLVIGLGSGSLARHEKGAALAVVVLVLGYQGWHQHLL